MIMSDHHGLDLAGRNPAEEIDQQALGSLFPNADSCLPYPPCGMPRKEGTALFELENIIREQIGPGKHGFSFGKR